MSDLIKVRSDDGKVWFVDEENNTVKRMDANGRMVNVTDLNTYESRDLGMGDVHIAGALSNYCAGYKLEESILEEVAPTVLVPHASDKFYTWDPDDALQGAHTRLVSENAPIPEISPRLSNTLFTTLPLGLATFIPQGLIANADQPLNPRLAGLNRIMQAMAIGREIDGAAAMTSASTFSSYTAAISASSKWNDGTASNPVKDLTTAVEKALQSINSIVMSERTWHDFTQNANVMKYGMYKDSADTIDPGKLSAILHLPKFVISKMKTKSNSLGTYGYVWGDGCLLTHTQKGPIVDAMTISTGKTFRWNKGGMGTDSNGFRTRTWFDPSRGQDGGEYIAVLSNEIVTVTAAATGYLLTACHQ